MISQGEVLGNTLIDLYIASQNDDVNNEPITCIKEIALLIGIYLITSSHIIHIVASYRYYSVNNEDCSVVLSLDIPATTAL